MKKRKDITHPHFVAVRLTDAEMTVLEQGASTFNISKSEYLRKLLLDKKIQHTIEIVADMDDIKCLVREYGKIGSNLNQIAKYFNTGGERALSIPTFQLHIFFGALKQFHKHLLSKDVQSTDLEFHIFQCFLPTFSYLHPLVL